MAIYFELAKNGWNICIFSYVNNDVNEKLSENIYVSVFPLCFLNQRFTKLRQLLLPFLLWRKGKKCDVLITNQAHNGGWIAGIAGKIWGAKIVARCGYVYGEYVKTEGLSGWRHALRSWLEKWTMRHADKCFIPTLDLIAWVKDNYYIKSTNICMVPNFVNTDLFKPDEKKIEFDLITIGRLSFEKRHWMIIEAAIKLSFKKILFIGSGTLKNDLIKKATVDNIELQIIEKVKNSELPDYINSSKYFVLATTREGHPKSLIEAMSCGCICIGADRPGINNMIRHNETGILFNSTPDGLQDAITNISNDKELSRKIQENARKYILENMSFSKIYSDCESILSRL